MKFNLKDLNPGAKFYFDENDPAKGSITLRALNMEALDAIRAKTTKRRVEYVHGRRHEVVEPDESIMRADLTWAYVIQDWEGIEDENGQPIPCTDENKAALMRGSLVFFRIVSDFLEQLDADMQAKVEAERKN
jgi:hypothetical protein